MLVETISYSLIRLKTIFLHLYNTKNISNSNVCMQAYDQQAVYDISYFRPSIDDAVRGSGLPSPQEVNFYLKDLCEFSFC